MSTKYYYFVASLPTLSLEHPVVQTVDAFLQDCQRLMTPEDFELLNAVVHAEVMETKNAAAREWIRFTNNLKNEMVVYRAARLGKEAADYLRGERETDPALQELVLQAGKAKNPLEAEKMFTKARWEKLNAIEEGHFFDFEYVLTYALRLVICQRYQVIRSPEGTKQFEALKKIDFPAGVGIEIE